MRATPVPGRRALVALLGLLIALTVGAHWWQETHDGATPAHPVPGRIYGEAGARFVASFGAAPHARWRGRAVAANAHLGGMTATSTLYVASLGSASESVAVLAYPRSLSGAQARWTLRVLDGATHLLRWHGLVAARVVRACRVGAATCPGELAALDVVDGHVVYALRATQVSAREVRRFFSSFAPAALG